MVTQAPVVNIQTKAKSLPKPTHGGNALAMCETFDVSYDDCLDLTAAINPMAYKFGDVPASVWQQLPQENDGLLQAAERYYGIGQTLSEQSKLMMTPGSSWTINQLPVFFSRCRRVWLPEQGYKEHEYSWVSKGFTIQTYSTLPHEKALKQGDIFVLINPNNPTTETYSQNKVLKLLMLLQTLSGYLIVDEAFMDVTPDASVLGRCHSALIVLRSFGKFFGLPGIRLGAVWAPSDIIDYLKLKLEPWAINSAARHIAQKAFSDIVWQRQARYDISQMNALLFEVLSRFIFNQQKERPTDTEPAFLLRAPLFITLMTQNASRYHESLAKQGVFTRLLDDKTGIRFGLATTAQVATVERALAEIKLVS